MTVLIKIAMMLMGALLVALGVVISPLPGPLGVPVMLIGLIVILRSSTWAKRQFMRLVRRYPRGLGALRAMLRPGAKVLALIWLNMLRCERRLLNRRQRILYRFRNWLRGFTGHRRHVNGAAAQA